MFVASRRFSHSVFSASKLPLTSLVVSDCWLVVQRCHSSSSSTASAIATSSATAAGNAKATPPPPASAKAKSGKVASPTVSDVVKGDKKSNEIVGKETKSKEMDMKSQRVGALAMKVGMLTLYDNLGMPHACTALLIEDCQVIQAFVDKVKGYCSIQVGAGLARPKTIHSGQRGLFEKFDLPVKRHLAEFRVTEDALLPVGTSITALHFTPGQYVDVTGITIGKGFQGGMKRFGFGGLPRSHGVSISHRSLGATGSRQDPGKVWKGKGMPGRMGGVQDTVQNLMVHEIDVLRNIVFVRGHVPGNKGGLIKMRDALWKSPATLPEPIRKRIPFPTFSWNRVELGAPGINVPTFPSRVSIEEYKQIQESAREQPTIKLFTKEALIEKLGVSASAMEIKEETVKAGSSDADAKKKTGGAAAPAATPAAAAQKKKGK